jgi:hypothetical protein
VHDGPADAKSPQDPRISGENMGGHSAAYGLHLAQHLQQAGVLHELHISPRASSEFQPQAWKFLVRYLKIEE